MMRSRVWIWIAWVTVFVVVTAVLRVFRAGLDTIPPVLVYMLLLLGGGGGGGGTRGPERARHRGGGQSAGAARRRPARPVASQGRRAAGASGAQYGRGPGRSSGAADRRPVHRTDARDHGGSD